MYIPIPSDVGWTIDSGQIKYLRVPEEIVDNIKEKQQNQPPSNRGRGGARGDTGGRAERGRGGSRGARARGRGRGQWWVWASIVRI